MTSPESFDDPSRALPESTVHDPEGHGKNNDSEVSQKLEEVVLEEDSDKQAGKSEMSTSSGSLDKGKSHAKRISSAPEVGKIKATGKSKKAPKKQNSKGSKNSDPEDQEEHEEPEEQTKHHAMPTIEETKDTRGVAEHSTHTDGSTKKATPSSKPLEFDEAFAWNRRPCKGTALHLAVLQGDVEKVLELCRYEGEINRAFTYETEFKGNTNYCKGEAIHLAVSQGWRAEYTPFLRITEILLDNKADISAKVMRDSDETYEVMHAAVFAEGRPGCRDIIELLLNRKADPTSRNIQGKGALHLAYQTGAKTIIELIQESMLAFEVAKKGEKTEETRRASIGDCEELDKGPNGGQTPLEVGFAFGNLSHQDLSDLAPLSATSAATFLQNEPRCIVRFFERALEDIEKRKNERLHGENSETAHSARLALMESLHIHADDLVKRYKIDMHFIAYLIRKDPMAAAKVLKATTSAPKCDNPGFHAIPTRAGTKDYMKDCYGGALRRAFNPDPLVFSFYVPDRTWEFDSKKFWHPEWHRRLSAKTPPCVDIDVALCYIPNLMDAEIFAAIVKANNVNMFESQVVQALVDQSWWQGAWRPDLIKVIINAWCLLLVTITLWQARIGEASQEAFVGISFSFVGARGAVDFLQECVEFIGYSRLRRWGTDNLHVHHPITGYLNCRNGVDLSCSLIFMVLLFDPDNLLVRAFTVLILWARLFGFFRCAEHIAVILMPIQRSTYSILPALFITLMFFCAIAQAYYVFQPDTAEDTFFNQFGLLFTGNYPGERSEEPAIQIIVYLGLLVFTIGLLNIFIGVIGEAYGYEKEQVKLTFCNERASGILTFLLRANVLRGVKVFKPLVVEVAALVAVVFMLGVQISGTLIPELEKDITILSVPVYLVCMTVLDFSVYQLSQGPWVTQSDEIEEERHYVWLAIPKDEAPEEQGTEDKIEELMEKMQECNNRMLQMEGGLGQQIKELMGEVREVKRACSRAETRTE